MQGISIFFLAAFAALSSAAAISGEHLTERSCAGFGQFCSVDSDCCSGLNCFESTHCYPVS
ncbi:uncharacterized protein N7503_001297 [Penicillium pulvis]|uniref:uncharacterized protein n=1 Tax=Penicillium pulvis TaxID=1562058 RepID=UPI002547F2AE|nr:uncharacterized protein N7503_001297 [Penicillium pulvis]KAJ5809079.1 hypothetical protein N7503_001297 [Penicillium pulvis]